MAPRESYMQMPLSFPEENIAENVAYPQLFQNNNTNRRVPHGIHVFCKKCFRRFMLGETIFKFYLLMAWCLGLAAIMLSQHKNIIFSIYAMIYLLAQVFGLLGTISHVRKIFIPYVIVLWLNIMVNMFFLIHFGIRCVSTNYERDVQIIGLIQVVDKIMFSNAWLCVIFSILYLIYNFLCLFSVIEQCDKFEKIQHRNELRRRELLVRNAIIYDRLINLNNRENSNNQQLVTTNPDSPPKYSSLDIKSHILESPPPKYCNLQMMKENFNDEKSENEEK
ncbi:unnamed protein product [Caenorhabditis angaria]|uniref:Uncharacterized protein n=1 Tax=Caenorhabditis angaria TaxID=860376 RepID=A0A9P1ICM5_9PELO|nr:unnamed protein product [Caenorhabditis angaria]